MKTIALMYHDIIDEGNARASGFASADADIYKLERGEFVKHLEAIKNTGKNPTTTENLAAGENFLITFDDGGKGAYTNAADALEKYGWRGHFFAAADFIGTPTFLSRAELRELRRRGHIVGSHSASHPLRMSACSREKLLTEWHTSTEKLADILGEKVTVASVPGGHFSRQVAETAVESGIEILFNSEPVAKTYKIENCLIFGRYSTWQDTPPEFAAAIARGEISPRLRQYLFWNTKKIAKKLGGEFYLTLRKKILARN